MLMVVVLVVLVGLCGCDLMPPPSHAYAHVNTVPGCFNVASRSGDDVRRPVALGSGLLADLHGQLADQTIEQPECWYLEPSGELRLIAGGECGPHKEFVFEKTATLWRLTHSENVQLVSCDKKAS